MKKHKIKFKDNTDLQQQIKEARNNGLSVAEICVKYPEYSDITYKRFFRAQGVPSAYDRTHEDRVKQASIRSEDAWNKLNPEKKSEHIKHLQSLAESQKGVTLQHTDQWKVNNAKHLQNLHQRFKDRFLEKYGVSNPSYIPSVIEQRKQTCLARYGVDSFFKTATFAAMPTVIHRKSIGELELRDWVLSLGIDCYSTREFGFEIDVYIPSKRIGVEYDGNYWHSAKFKKPDHIPNKQQKAASNSIKLIHVFEHEWADRKPQVQSFLLSALGMNQEKVYARKCEIRTVPKTEARDFLNRYHILGSVNHIEAVGLYHCDELLCVATLGYHHRDRNKLIVSRFCGKTNVTTVGGLSKISKHLYNKYGVLYTWCDLRWSNGESYKNAGWSLDALLPPDYFYFKSGRLYISKQSRKKSVVNTPKGTTELEHATLDGLTRVYDGGKLRFVYNPTI